MTRCLLIPRILWEACGKLPSDHAGCVTSLLAPQHTETSPASTMRLQEKGHPGLSCSNKHSPSVLLLPSNSMPTRSSGNHLQDVVAGVVAVVTHADLRAHVPATKGACRELQAPNLQEHVGNGWQPVPLQAQVLKPFKPAGKKSQD